MNKQQAVDENYGAFKGMLPRLLEKGEYALLRHKKVVNFFDSATEALLFAQERYEDSLYSVQKVTNEAVCIPYLIPVSPRTTS